MAKITSMLIERYFTIPTERFTDKVVAAMNLARVFKVKEEDMVNIKYIIDNTHTDLRTSIFVLDRMINPSKGDITNANTRFEFERNMTDKQVELRKKGIDIMGEKIYIGERVMQNYCCNAIMEIDNIIMPYIAQYDEDIAIRKIKNKPKDGEVPNPNDYSSLF